MIRDFSGQHLVIGGSGGLGQELVRQLADCPDVIEIVATYRSADPMALLQHSKVRYIKWELGDEFSLREPGDKYDGIWIMTGACEVGLDALSEESRRRMNDVNWHGPLAIIRRRTRLVKPDGLIVVLSSAAAWCPSTYGHWYSESKRRLMNALRWYSGTQCLVFWAPGALDTGLWKDAPRFLQGLVKLQAASANGTSVPDAVADLLRGVLAGEELILTTHDSKMSHRFPPLAWVMDWIMTALIEEEAVMNGREVSPRLAGPLARLVASWLGPYLRRHA
jgi:NAD(P)-dependent dehydrogenase (short-subunit alcohol dehydrogenase family)